MQISANKINAYLCMKLRNNNMSQPKFILTNKGELRLGMVNRHYELLKADEHCYGGGYYEFDYLSNRLLLWGFSTDFGKPRWEKCQRINVSADYRGFRIIYSTWREWETAINISTDWEVSYF